MILQALYEYYQRKAADPGSTIAPHGLEWKEIPYLILIDKKGNFLELHKSRKTKSDSREKRKAIFEAKTKCAQKSRLLPSSGQNTSVVQTPFESCLNDAFY